MEAPTRKNASYVDNTGHDLLIINARLIDGTGALPQNNRSILIRQGKIAEIGEMQAAEGARVLDVAGATVMPGIIDAHVHLQSVPGSVYRKDSDQDLKEQRRHHLKAYLACGVTTVLDNLIAAPMLKELQDYLDAGGAGPRIYALAPAFYPPDGYLDHGMLTPYWGPHFQPAANEGDIEALFEEFQDLKNIVGVKVLLEPGFGATPVWPIHSPEIRKAIVRQAGKRGLPIYAHAYNNKMQAIALEMGVYNLAHAGFLKGSPSKKFLQEMKRLGAYVTTTLASTLEQMLVQFHPERLDDPLLKFAVPQRQLDSARDPEAWKETNSIMFNTSAPKWMPAMVMNLIIKMMNMEKQINACLESSSKAIKLMHQEGIPVSLGTDTSNWPLFLCFFHGPSTIRELELLGRAGLAPLDVISSATRIPAEMMGLGDQLGTVEKGKLADMVVVKDDPLAGLTALKNLMFTIKGGQAHTPQEWLQMN